MPRVSTIFSDLGVGVSSQMPGNYYAIAIFFVATKKMGDIALNSRINSIKGFALGKVGNSPYKTTSHESKVLPAVCRVLVKYLLI